MNKAALRKAYLAKRKALSVDDRQLMDAKIARYFASLITPDIRTVHIFLPLAAKAETDTRPIINMLWQKNIRVAVPVVDDNDHMVAVLLTPDTALAPNKWGIPEPVNAEKIAPKSMDLMALPLLAYDSAGYRVGYGRGYYDRYLPLTRRDMQKVGLSYFAPTAKKIPKNPWDVAMDACITPEEIIHF